MSPFITFRDKDDVGTLQYYVLQREHPHCVGVISGVPREKTIAQAAIGGYHLWVIFDGTLRGNMLPAQKNIQEEVQNVIENMAAWFWAERIAMDEKRFKKYKIGANAPIPSK